MDDNSNDIIDKNSESSSDSSSTKDNFIKTRSNYRKRKYKLLELDDNDNPINQQNNKKIKYNTIYGNNFNITINNPSFETHKVIGDELEYAGDKEDNGDGEDDKDCENDENDEDGEDGEDGKDSDDDGNDKDSENDDDRDEECKESEESENNSEDESKNTEENTKIEIKNDNTTNDKIIDNTNNIAKDIAKNKPENKNENKAENKPENKQENKKENKTKNKSEKKIEDKTDDIKSKGAKKNKKKRKTYEKKQYINKDEADKFIRMIITPLNKRSNNKDIIKNLIKSKNDPEFKYFMNLPKKKRDELTLKQLEVNDYYNVDTPLRFKILDSELNISSKVVILNKIDHFQNSARFDSEYGKLKNWVDNLSKIPFNNYIDMPIKLSDGNIVIKNFITQIKQTLDDTIYGQEHAKNKLLQIIAQWISNPKSKSSYVALEGPPGVGKTSLIKHGVSKSFNRPFNFIALGGATDSSYLEGHSYTYEGATYGKIVEMIIQSKVMNPIIFFDELDKVSTTHKGEEINGILTHLTDNTQNNCFNDKFFTGIDFDLSRSMLFFSYNDEYKINPILKDRLTVIKFDSYKLKDKVNIALKYLIPELMKNINIKEDEVIFNDSTIQYIIEKYTSHEKGVRNLKRSLEEILMKINLLKLLTVSNSEKIKVINTNETSNIEINKVDKTDIDIPYKIKNFNLPLTITNEIINILLNEFKKDEMSISVQRMYI